MRQLLLYMPWIVSTLCLANEPAVDRQDGIAKGSHHIDLPAYAKAGYTLKPGFHCVTIPPIPSGGFFVVPLVAQEALNQHIGFDPQTHSLVIHHSGLYLANFFVKIRSTQPSNGRRIINGPPEIALRKTGTHGEVFISQVSETLWPCNDIAPPFNGGASSLSFGTHQVLVPLCKGDQLQLVISSLPTSASWFFFNDNATNSDEVAYLTLVKLGQYTNKQMAKFKPGLLPTSQGAASLDGSSEALCRK